MHLIKKDYLYISMIVISIPTTLYTVLNYTYSNIPIFFIGFFLFVIGIFNITNSRRKQKKIWMIFYLLSIFWFIIGLFSFIAFATGRFL